MNLTKIAILGDFNPVISTHHALNDSIRQVKKLFSEEIQLDWIDSDIFNCHVAFEKQGYKGLWIAPGSPYKNDQNVMDAITYVRTNKIPVLGNCAGFQYMLIEFARNVCGIANADHEETNPNSENLLIAKLSCSLVEQEEELELTDPDSMLFSIIKKDHLLGRYFCNYGLNSAYVGTLKVQGLKITAMSADKQVRAFELEDHPFFIGSLFQPALTSSNEVPNPIIVAFFDKIINYKNI